LKIFLSILEKTRELEFQGSCCYPATPNFNPLIQNNVIVRLFVLSFFHLMFQYRKSATMIRVISILLLLIALVLSVAHQEIDATEEPHPDPNDEDYLGMAYIGRLDEGGRRVGFDFDNGELSMLSILIKSDYPD
jgi:hypothetical protein